MVEVLEEGSRCSVDSAIDECGVGCYCFLRAQIARNQRRRRERRSRRSIKVIASRDSKSKFFLFVRGASYVHIIYGLPRRLWLRPKDFVCRCGDPVKYGGPFDVVGIGYCWNADTNVILEKVAYVSVVENREVISAPVLREYTMWRILDTLGILMGTRIDRWSLSTYVPGCDWASMK